jgi:hypothetical protein
MFLDVRGVHPLNGLHEAIQTISHLNQYSCGAKNPHLIQRGGHISHQGHEQEWHLKNGLVHEIQAIEKLVIPDRALEIDYP